MIGEIKSFFHFDVQNPQTKNQFGLSLTTWMKMSVLTFFESQSILNNQKVQCSLTQRNCGVEAKLSQTHFIWRRKFDNSYTENQYQIQGIKSALPWCEKNSIA